MTRKRAGKSAINPTMRQQYLEGVRLHREQPCLNEGRCHSAWRCCPECKQADGIHWTLYRALGLKPWLPSLRYEFDTLDEAVAHIEVEKKQWEESNAS